MNKFNRFAKITFFFTSFIFYINFISCKIKDDNIPNISVYFEIDMSDPEFSKLQIPGNYVYVKGGVNGIIIYRQSTTEFYAYERTCPHDPDCGRVYVDKSGLTAIDTVCCKSEFLLPLNGAIFKGPSNFPLKSYSVEFNQNNNILLVTN